MLKDSLLKEKSRWRRLGHQISRSQFTGGSFSHFSSPFSPMPSIHHGPFLFLFAFIVPPLLPSPTSLSSSLLLPKCQCVCVCDCVLLINNDRAFPSTQDSFTILSRCSGIPFRVSVRLFQKMIITKPRI